MAAETRKESAMVWNFCLHENRWFGITIGRVFIGFVCGTPTSKEDANVQR